MVGGYIMDEHLERPSVLVYYQVLREPGIAGCDALAVRGSHQSDIYLRRRGHAHMLNH